MKHLIFTLLLCVTTCMNAKNLYALSASTTTDEHLFITPKEQMENIDRSPIAMPASDNNGIFLSWRLLGTDEPGTMFDIVRNGTTIKSGMTVTNFTDTEGTVTSSYEIVVKNNGKEVERTKPFIQIGRAHV